MNHGNSPINKYVVSTQEVKGNTIVNTEVPEYYLVLTSQPNSSDDFLTPFISRLLDYRWRFNEFLLFHYSNSKNKIALLDFLNRVEFNLTYQFINDQISGELHEVTTASEIEEYLKVIKRSIRNFVDSHRSSTPLSFKLTKEQICELTTKIFLTAKVIRDSDASDLRALMVENRTPKQLIKFEGERNLIASFFNALHQRSLLDTNSKSLSKYIQDSFVDKQGKPFLHQSLLNALNLNDPNFLPFEKMKEKFIAKAGFNSQIANDLQELFSSDQH